jgi:glycosyltransferase involved in cell wall biosynthesis
MTSPVVSVVVAARDEARHLPACLNSVRSQRGADFECLIVDDGSIDETNVIATRLTLRDERFRLIRHEEARGLAGARNSGLREAKGSLVTFLDGDDFLFPGALRARVVRMSRAEDDVIGCYGDWLSVPERFPRLPVPKRPARRADVWMTSVDHAVPFIASAPVLRRELVTGIGGFDEDLRTAEDADFWQWWLRLQGRTVYEPTLCVAYRRRAGSMTRRDLAGHFRANQRAFSSFDRPLPGSPPAVLSETDSTYRLSSAAMSRAGLAAAVAFAEDRVDEARGVLAELDPVVVRLTPPVAAAAAATALAIRRIRGTSGGRHLVARIKASADGFARLVEETAAPAASAGELREAAAWIGAQRA